MDDILFPFSTAFIFCANFQKFKCHRMTLHRDIRDEMAVLDVELISDRGRGVGEPFPHIIREMRLMLLMH